MDKATTDPRIKGEKLIIIKVDLENWKKEDTYKEAINVTKQLIKLYLERGF